MTTELVLLLGFFAFLLIGAFLGPSGPRATFNKSGPRLGARIEQQINVGKAFTAPLTRRPLKWTPPPGDAPGSDL